MTTHDELIADRRARLDEERQRSVLRARRVGVTVTSLALVAIMGLVVLDGVDVVDTVGVDDAWVEASADGTTLAVRYPAVSRPALASPFEIVVTRTGGFQGQQVEITVETDYLEIWDLNGIFPAPAEETATAEEVHWTFDPPDGDSLRIVYEARIEPARQNGARGHVAVLDDDGTELASIDVDTRIRP
jgi:hypothetical protein